MLAKPGWIYPVDQPCEFFDIGGLEPFRAAEREIETVRNQREMRREKIEFGEFFGRSVEIMIGDDFEKIDSRAVFEQFGAKLRAVAETAAEPRRGVQSPPPPPQPPQPPPPPSPPPPPPPHPPPPSDRANALAKAASGVPFKASKPYRATSNSAPSNAMVSPPLRAGVKPISADGVGSNRRADRFEVGATAPARRASGKVRGEQEKADRAEYRQKNQKLDFRVPERQGDFDFGGGEPQQNEQAKAQGPIARCA